MRKAGFTLVEFIVVMGIIGLLTAISLPSLVRMGAFSQNGVDDSAREVYGTLRAARSHAANERVDTAVVYNLKRVEDSLWGGDPDDPADDQLIADSVGIARKMRPDEIRRWHRAGRLHELYGELAGLDSPNLNDPVQQANEVREVLEEEGYILLRGEFGRMKPLDEESAIWADVAVLPTDHPNFTLALEETMEQSQLLAMNSTGSRSEQGLQFVRLFTVDEDPENRLAPPVITVILPRDLDWRPTGSSLLANNDLDIYFPAHVFLPSGEIQALEAVSSPRFNVLLGWSPIAPVDKRFLDVYEPADNPAYHWMEFELAEAADLDVENLDVFTDEVDVHDGPIRLDLFQYTGRIAVVDLMEEAEEAEERLILAQDAP